jgi:hypothetical protein
MIPKIKINRKYSIEFDKIYAIEDTGRRKGQKYRIWVRYLDNNGQKKVAVYQGNPNDICYIINQVRVLHQKSLLKVKKKK